MPLDATPFTRTIPLASSGASNPLSAASTASLRTAVIRTLIETAPSPRASSATRQAATVALVKPGRGSRPYHSKNSSRPRVYTRRVTGEAPRLSPIRSLAYFRPVIDELCTHPAPESYLDYLRLKMRQAAAVPPANVQTSKNPRKTPKIMEFGRSPPFEMVGMCELSRPPC